MLPHSPTERILHVSWGLQLLHARYHGLRRCLASTTRYHEVPKQDNANHDMMKPRLVLAPRSQLGADET